MKNDSILLISGCNALSLPVHTKGAPINLRDNFFADPSVVFSDDGLTATLVEDSSLFVVLLSNDPSLGEPAVFIPGPDASIMFDYYPESGFDPTSDSLDCWQEEPTDGVLGD